MRVSLRAWNSSRHALLPALEQPGVNGLQPVQHGDGSAMLFHQSARGAALFYTRLNIVQQLHGSIDQPRIVFADARVQAVQGGKTLHSFGCCDYGDAQSE